jgi:hypothetical protein
MVTLDSLRGFLKLLREFNVGSAQIESGYDKIAVVLNPELPPGIKGDELTPPAWKSPDRLDNMEMFDEPKVP